MRKRYPVTLRWKVSSLIYQYITFAELAQYNCWLCTVYQKHTVLCKVSKHKVCMLQARLQHTYYPGAFHLMVSRATNIHTTHTFSTLVTCTSMSNAFPYLVPWSRLFKTGSKFNCVVSSFWRDSLLTVYETVLIMNTKQIHEYTIYTYSS